MACEDWAKMDILTQNSEEGLGGLDRHGEERAGVLALIWQADVTNSDGELLPWGSHQLNSVVPQGCRLKEGTKNHGHRKKDRKQESLLDKFTLNSVMAINF